MCLIHVLYNIFLNELKRSDERHNIDAILREKDPNGTHW